MPKQMVSLDEIFSVTGVARKACRTELSCSSLTSEHDSDGVSSLVLPYDAKRDVFRRLAAGSISEHLRKYFYALLRRRITQFAMSKKAIAYDNGNFCFN